MYFMPSSWDERLGWEGLGRALVRTLDFSVTEDFCHSSFLSAMVKGVVDVMWAASSLNRYL